MNPYFQVLGITSSRRGTINGVTDCLPFQSADFFLFMNWPFVLFCLVLIFFAFHVLIFDLYVLACFNKCYIYLYICYSQS